MATSAAPATSSNPTSSFIKAYAAFYDSLSENDQALFAPCATVDDLLTGLKRLSSLTKRKRQPVFMDRIYNFAMSLEPYFKVVDLMIQSNPKYIALVWGALRLIFQLTSNFPTFSEKLTKLLGNLSSTLLQHKDIEVFCASCPSITGRLGSYLEGFYTDLFHVFTAIARIFTSRKQRLKRTPAIMCDIFWRPFDVRFREFEERFAQHKVLIQGEISLVQVRLTHHTQQTVVNEQELNQNARNALKKLESIYVEAGKNYSLEQYESTKRDLKSWISAPGYEEIFHRSHKQLQEGTNEWIFHKVELIQWLALEWRNRPGSRRKLGSNVLWIQGNPGCGKTTLASSLIHGLRNKVISLPKEFDVYYFFFSSQPGSSSSTAAACRALLSQVLHHQGQDHIMMERLNFLRDSLSDGSSIADMTQVIDLLGLCFSMLNAIVVLDGMDECDDADLFMETLLSLSNETATKFILLSRPNVPELTRLVLKRDRLLIRETDTTDDIKKYFAQQIGDLIEDGRFPGHVSTTTLVLSLMKGAGGMFLWATLMIKYLNSPALSPLPQLKELSNLTIPEKLATMYKRITKLIEESTAAECRLGKATIQWVLYSPEALTLDVLHEVLILENSGNPNDQSDQFQNFDDLVSVTTGGLVQHDLEDGSCVRFIHTTVTEFLLENGDRKNIGIIPPRSLSNLNMCLRCTGRIMYQINTGALGKDGTQDTACLGQFTTYAIKNWTYFLGQTFDRASDEDLSTDYPSECTDFLRTLSSLVTQPENLTLWLISSYRLSLSPHLDLSSLKGYPHLLQWSESLPGLRTEIEMVSQCFAKLPSEMAQIEEDWGDSILLNPDILWDEVHAFSKPTLLAGKSDTEVTYMTPIGLQVESSVEARALAITSKSGFIEKFGNATTVLSIWPSPLFEKTWKAKQLISQDHCTGWTTHYELWKHADGRSSVRVVDMKIPLEGDEVWTQLRQSFCMRWEHLQVSFPLVIEDGLLCFIVLRTLFNIEPGTTSTDNASMQAAVIPMTFDQTIEPFWDLTHRENTWRYTYEFKFSQNNDRLFFSDTVANTKHGEVYSSHIAIFKVSYGFSIQIAPINCGTTDTLDLLTHIVFHPREFVVILAYHDGVKAWRYFESISNMIYIWKRASGVWWNGEMKLSPCGNLLLITGQADPISIPQSILTQRPGLLKKGSHSIVTSTSATQSSRHSSNQNPAFRLESSSGSLSHRTPSTALQITHDGVMSFSVFDLHSEKTASLDLFSVPNWCRGQTGMTPKVLVPPQDSSHVTVAMDKNAEKAYALTGPSEEKFPLVVSRKLSALIVRDGCRAALETAIKARNEEKTGCCGDIDNVGEQRVEDDRETSIEDGEKMETECEGETEMEKDGQVSRESKVYLKQAARLAAKRRRLN